MPDPTVVHLLVASGACAPRDTTAAGLRRWLSLEVYLCTRHPRPRLHPR